eukprot:scaffold137984_cov104-Cyclotella_meneghiniana.AAC.1
MGKPIKTFFKTELGENLFHEILKKDCLICLSPIATLFPESKSLKVKVPPSGELLGFNKGGFIIPQSIATYISTSLVVSLRHIMNRSTPDVLPLAFVLYIYLHPSLSTSLVLLVVPLPFLHCPLPLPV